MQSFRGSIRLIQRHTLTSANAISLPNGVVSSKSIGHSFDSMKNCLVRSLHLVASRSQVGLLCLLFLFLFCVGIFSLNLMLIE